MRRPSLHFLAALIGVALAAALGSPAAQAQAGIGDIVSDPFTFYYAYYLPNQQVQALRPRPIDTINQASQDRQYFAKTQRESLYNPISPYATDNDPLRPYSQQGGERIARPYRFQRDSSNSDGAGPALYYNRAAQYFPELRAGRGANSNVARIQPRRGRGGGGGMGGMGMGGMGGGGGFM